MSEGNSLVSAIASLLPTALKDPARNWKRASGQRLKNKDGWSVRSKTTASDEIEWRDGAGRPSYPSNSHTPLPSPLLIITAHSFQYSRLFTTLRTDRFTGHRPSGYRKSRRVPSTLSPTFISFQLSHALGL